MLCAFAGLIGGTMSGSADLVEDTDLWAEILAPSLVAMDLIPWAVEILERPEDWVGDIKSRFAT